MKVSVHGTVQLRDTLGRYMERLPKAAAKDLEKITEDYVFEFKQEILTRFPELFWKGTLTNSIRVEPMKDGFMIPMAIQGILLDLMAPHFAPMWKPSPKTGDILGEWALEKLPPWVKISHVLYVTPHPWMREPMLRARQKIIERISTGEFHNTMEKRGR